MKVVCNVKCKHQSKGFCTLKRIVIEDFGYYGLYCNMQK